jgi:hypothetical protein
VQRIQKVERQLVPKCGSSPCRVALKWSRSLPDHGNFVDRDFEQELPNDGSSYISELFVGRSCPNVRPSEVCHGWNNLNRQQATDASTRAQAGRILERGLGKRELAKDDHDHLVRLVSARSGLPLADADRRVAQVLSESRDAARKGSSKCRYSSIHFGRRIGSWSSGGVGCSSDRRPASR